MRMDNDMMCFDSQPCAQIVWQACHQFDASGENKIGPGAAGIRLINCVFLTSDNTSQRKNVITGT